MAYARSPSSSSTEECAFSHNCVGIVHSMIERTSCVPLPWLLSPGYPLLTPVFAREICPFPEVFSGGHVSTTSPHHLFPGRRYCPGPRLPCGSGYALRGDTVCNHQGVARGRGRHAERDGLRPWPALPLRHELLCRQSSTCSPGTC